MPTGSRWPVSRLCPGVGTLVAVGAMGHEIAFMNYDGFRRCRVYTQMSFSPGQLGFILFTNYSDAVSDQERNIQAIDFEPPGSLQ